MRCAADPRAAARRLSSSDAAARRSTADARRVPFALLAVAVAAGLAGCAGKPKVVDNEPTLKSLAGREVVVAQDQRIDTSEEKTIAAYQRFLEAAPKAAQRAEAMRRLGDLEMDRADAAAAAATAGGPDYKTAIARYEETLKAFPKDPGNDRVLYQLARAQELGGQLETSLKTLDRLVAEYPKTAYLDEAQFRRGELLFTTRDYVKAEQAYSTVLKGAPDNPYRERSLYMLGWSQFKQGRLPEALQAFFGVLDLKVAGREDDDDLQGLSRGDRELVEDTFRVTSISLANLNGAESIPPLVTSEARRSYEYRVYKELGELYIKQERVKDAADTFGAFTRRHPLHAQAPQMQARVIGIYENGGFPALALEAKKDYVTRYGVNSEFRKANPQGWEKAQPLVKTHLTELAKHHHALAQKTKNRADVQEAIRWYGEFIASFPQDPEAAQNHFLLAELLFEDKRFGDAAAAYEKTAYGYPTHAKSAEAGYAALLAYANQEKLPGQDGAALAAVQRAGVDSALRFAGTFKSDPRAGAVLTNAAERLYALKDMDRAGTVARQVLALDPPAAPEQRRVALTVVGHTSFERGDFVASEKAYTEALALMPARDAARNDISERLAASVYKQGEKARAAGNARDAIGHFSRIAAVAPQSTVVATAQYDAAAALIELKDWPGAARALEDFRQRYPNHPLQGEVGAKLAVAYLEQQQWSLAAGEFERVATTARDPEIARSAQWQAAELHEKGGARSRAAQAFERYVRQHPQPLEPNLEARWKLANLAKSDGNARRQETLLREIVQADRMAGGGRTDRTRTLAGLSALALTEPALRAYQAVPLNEPLARQLKLKKTRMEEVLKAYAAASEYGVSEVTTAATFQTAALYQDFGKALLTSQRPRGLKKAELDQYNVMLEEQAFPFEEKAIELHEANARRATQGLYDEWVRKSFKALAEMKPVRYGKVERSEGVVDAIR
jgi:outer membrane protein assembly factor BamD (BamD/ComL family)